MRLTELSPQWIRHLEEGRRRFVVAVDQRVEANGIRFRCPTCTALGTAIGAHMVLLWDTSVGAGVTPGPLRWAMEGVSFDDLTLAHPVHLATECKGRFRIANGEIQPCS